MDRFDAMRVFIRVAELKSFTKAAESLRLPKATVSTSIQDLEALVEMKLLNRTTRQVQITSEGLSFLDRCKDLLSELEETESMFKNDSSQIKGRIRIDMTVSLAREFLIPLLPQFLEKYPQIEIELSSTDRKVDLIREGIDIVIRGGPTEPGLGERELGEMSVVNAASPAYLEKYGKPRSLEDLKNHKLVYYTQNLGSKPDGFEYFDGDKYREIKMSGIITVNSVDSYRAACLAGLGICQNPLLGIYRELKNGTLIEVLPKFRAQPMRTKIVFQQRRMLSKRVRVFMDWLEPLLRAHIQ